MVVSAGDIMGRRDELAARAIRLAGTPEFNQASRDLLDYELLLSDLRADAVRRWNVLQWRWAGRIPAPRVTVVATPRPRVFTAPIGTPPPRSAAGWTELRGIR